jgi:hypothetical protein
VLKGLGQPKRAEIQKLYHANDLTILNASKKANGSIRRNG